MSHTPGPWHRGGREGAIVYDASPEGWAVANVVTYHGRASDENRANAQLISAAPDLLAALTGIIEHCALVHKHWGEGSNAKEADSAIEAARAAISKATGR